MFSAMHSFFNDSSIDDYFNGRAEKRSQAKIFEKTDNKDNKDNY